MSAPVIAIPDNIKLIDEHLVTYPAYKPFTTQKILTIIRLVI